MTPERHPTRLIAAVWLGVLVGCAAFWSGAYWLLGLAP